MSASLVGSEMCIRDSHRTVSRDTASCPCCRSDIVEADWVRLDRWEEQQPDTAPAALLIGGGATVGAAVQSLHTCMRQRKV
eukprot:15072854-Alexandrium_andersonii.AAC.1